MSLRRFTELYEIIWMFESHAQQRLSWEDSAQARIARARAEALAAAQLAAMLDANPSGQLGHAKLDDEEALRKAGLL
ncbi:hypothetical protein T281_14665 [Rhodomicrobium udaipurense JA643]|uniref:Uncharacterized protein n=1 Tax=Rhodomicrobium udaipurense TaxID=1202716 RepID=A0A8I1KKS4_9HYPH|nr:hypothetical protein [Rhodomicrobium udaipurense]KAI93772.1 hypothetical protein T281_14665 [Rhodomicrobium udaipurense JA643]MBJ7544419.1 hypothetical protein [Rhodomicrobium udaipurense]